MKKNDKTLKMAIRLLATKCPRLSKMCYWAGTSSVSIEDLRHRQSFDLDFHTRKALQDVRPILAEIQAVFPGRFRVAQSPDEFGSGFRGTLRLSCGEIAVEVLSNYEDVPERDLTTAKSAPGMKRVSVSRYLADKIQCIAERAEARDLVDIQAVLRKYPALRKSARSFLADHDALILTERLLAWTDREIAKDLKAYTDVDPKDAGNTRDLLLKWLKPAFARKHP